MSMSTKSQVIPIALGALGKVFLVQGEAGTVLVDAGLPGQADLIVQELAMRGIVPQDIRLILITHGHSDHFGSARELRERTGAPVAVHAADAEALRRGENPPETVVPTSRLFGPLMSLLMRAASTAPIPPLEPDIVFDAPWRLDEYGVAGEVMLTPGHTPGSVTVLLDSGEAIIGDVVMGSILFPKRAQRPRVAWDLARNMESLRAVLERRPTLVYITHGQAFAPETLRALVTRYA